MRTRKTSRPPRRALAFVALLACAGVSVTEARQPPVLRAPADSRADEFSTITLPDGVKLSFALEYPPGFERSKTYPVLVALPPGAQDREMVEKGLDMYWREEASRRGWVVVSPVAPGQRGFSEKGALAIPALLSEVARRVNVEGGKYHLAGASNGGRGAFHVAVQHPERVASLTVLPGVPPSEQDTGRLARLKGIPVSMFVGEKDPAPRWVTDSRTTHEQLTKLGIAASLEVLPGQGHVLAIEPARLFDAMEKARSAAKSEGGTAEVARVLDEFHDAAAQADRERYFSLLADDAVFLGTDPTERWTKAEFLAWVRREKLLENGRGWVYTPTARKVGFSPDGATAWFDEVLKNTKLGECRGTGVLVRTAPGWRIEQYNLTVPVPNELMAKVVEIIKRGATKDGGEPPPAR